MPLQACPRRGAIMPLQACPCKHAPKLQFCCAGASAPLLQKGRLVTRAVHVCECAGYIEDFQDIRAGKKKEVVTSANGVPDEL